MIKEIENLILNSSNVIKETATLSGNIESAVNTITKCLLNKNKIILFGNGGSAADAQHIAAEFIGRFKSERKSYFGSDNNIFATSRNSKQNQNLSKEEESLLEEIILEFEATGDSN